MGRFDNYNYEINKRLPEFWKSDIFLKPIERFSALLMRSLLQQFMEKMGVMQPFMIWKTLPEEYDWEYGFEDYDMRLASYDENPNCNQTLMLSETNHIVAQLPLTKRNTHAYIVVDLSSMSFSDTTEYTKIKELVVKNADQTLKIKDIDSKTTIEIYTESNTILINDSAPASGQVEGSIDIIKREPRESIENITDPLDINEKCELEIYISSGESAYCDLYVGLHYPVYVTEQNIRVFTLSAFPLEYIRLYGYMCHKYNDNHQWVYLWEKTYGYEDRIVYDRITKQYDCEIFYAEIKLYGLPAPIYVGFPASYADFGDGVFTLNGNLDYWGGILHMPRRLYKTDIPEEQQRYCFPKYYDYSIEQDFPYEQRLINEYKYNEDWQDFINIRDTDGTDIALVRCKDPYIENLYMYTETISPVDLLNSQATYNPICITQQDKNNVYIQRGEWENENNLQYESKSYSIVHLNRQDEEHITDKSYQSNVLSMEFDLSSLPENCRVKGLELKFKGASNTHADNIYLDERSFLKYTQKVLNSETGNHIWQSKELPLNNYFTKWSPDDASYVLGYKDSIFQEDDVIDRDSIEKGYLRNGVYQKNKIRFDIGFSNQSNYLDLIIKLFNIQLIVYFELLQEDIAVSVDIPNKIIVYDNEQNNTSAIKLNLEFTNKGDIKEIDYNSFIILPPELYFVDEEQNLTDTIQEFLLGNQTTLDYITDNKEYNILHIDETWDTSIMIGAKPNPVFKSGRYDILIVCGEKIIKEEVFVYDKNYITSNDISISPTDNDALLVFDPPTKDAIDGVSSLKLSLKDSDGNPIPKQYVNISNDKSSNVYNYILDDDGELIVENVDIPTETVYKAQYGDVTAYCRIYSFLIKLDMIQYLKEQYNVLKTDDIDILRWALLKGVPNETELSYIVSQLSENDTIDNSALNDAELQEQSYQTKIYKNSISRGQSYAVVCLAKARPSDMETGEIQPRRCFVFSINIKNIQENVLNSNISSIAEISEISNEENLEEE